MAEDTGHHPRITRPHLITAALLVMLGALLLADLLTPPNIRFGPLMVAVPALAAVLGSPAEVLVTLAATVVCVTVAANAERELGQPNYPVQLATIVLISLGAVAASWVRQRRERELAKSRTVAEATQRLVLRPLPQRLGSLSLNSLYLTADDEALIGGDLYAAHDNGRSVRLLIGDAEGKGLAAVEMASFVLSAFRRGSRADLPLDKLATEMDEDFRADLRESAATSPDGDRTQGGSYQQEGFATAVVLDIPRAVDGAPVHLINLGHTEPFLIHDGTATPVHSPSPAPPLGLGDLGGAGARPRVDTLDFPPGATLLLYTDGVIEARDKAGKFYPLAERLPLFADLPAGELLPAISRDLREHVGTHLADDVAIVAVQRHRDPEPDPPAPRTRRVRVPLQPAPAPLHPEHRGTPAADPRADHSSGPTAPAGHPPPRPPPAGS